MPYCKNKITYQLSLNRSNDIIYKLISNEKCNFFFTKECAEGHYLNHKFKICITYCISHVLFYILRHLSPYLID